ncbi:succinate dehydrogenase cytochrome b subunit [Pedobacter ginsengiterrae]|uniref:succinate dehydrogenase cytochrome b subunit n=1 Tax=Pedobacter ginsengiterrae TaxID=871696 RepID=UPI0031D640E3
MNWLNKTLTSSIGKKIVMAITGLFLIIFLIIHTAINGLIFYNDHGKTFTAVAHFMGNNPVTRTIEIFLILGFLIHIWQGLYLWNQNRKARPISYAYKNDAASSTWYSRSMALLGTLILLFLIIHTSAFWIPNRINQLRFSKELPLYEMMLEKFDNPVMVGVYLLGCFSLFWHLLHGFKSAFRSMGWSHLKYNKAIYISGIAYSIIIPTILSMMPLSIFCGWIG